MQASSGRHVGICCVALSAPGVVLAIVVAQGTGGSRFFWCTGIKEYTGLDIRIKTAMEACWQFEQQSTKFQESGIQAIPRPAEPSQIRAGGRADAAVSVCPSASVHPQS